MKKYISNRWCLLVFLMMINMNFGQNDLTKLTPPELADKRVFELNFAPDPVESSVVSAYLEGETEKDSIFILAKANPVTQRYVVSILTEKPGNLINVDIVKKHWQDFKRSATTENGITQISFLTADKFGIVITSDTPGLSFKAAVWGTNDVAPTQHTLFHPTVNNVTSSENTILPSITTESAQKSILLLYLVPGFLTLISILLVLLLVKKRKKEASVVLVLLCLHLSASANIRQVQSEQILRIIDRIEGMAGPNGIEALDKFISLGQIVLSAASDQALYLDEADQQDVPDMDPAGQPSLPSSCYATYKKINGPKKKRSQNSNRSGTKNSENRDTKYDNADKASAKSDPKDSMNATHTDLESSTPSEKPDLSESELEEIRNGESEKEYRLPRYDQTGQLIDAGDFPDAPQQISPSAVDEDNPFILSETNSHSNRSAPKYDKDGNLLDAGDYKDAPQHIDPHTGLPPMNPFTGTVSESSRFVRQPKYDKDGHLMDPGDFKDAPDKIDPLTLNTLNTPAPTAESTGTKNPLEDSSREGNRNPSNTDQPDEDSTDSSKACRCLEVAYEDMEALRLRFEKLRIISTRMRRQVDFGIKFGDDVSAIHGVSGLAWQSQKLKVLKSLKKFEGTYDNKHKELIGRLYDRLMEIDRCEKLMGYDNWYNNAGFLYYNFMRDKYKR